MKPAHLAILIALLVIGLANLLAALGVIGGGSSASPAGGGGNEYRALAVGELDALGYKAAILEIGIAATDGTPDDLQDSITPGDIIVQWDRDSNQSYVLTAENLQNPVFQNPGFLTLSLKELGKDGWELVGVSLNGFYIVRRAN